MHKLIGILFILVMPGTYAYSHSNDLKDHFPKAVQSLINDEGFINLPLLRYTCNLLTDEDLTSIKRTVLSKKNKGVKRHIKHICENLEMTAWSKEAAKKEDLQLIYELELIKASYIQKSKSSDEVTFIDKIKMGWTSIITPLKFKFEKDRKSKVVIQDNIFFEENNNEHRHKRFDDLAKQKKIEVKDKTYVVFDAVSDSGSAPKIKAIDVKDPEDEWIVKWGDEIHSDVAGSRIFAALGFDVDHPYYKGEDALYLILPDDSPVHSAHDLVLQIEKHFKINISKYISREGIIGDAEIGNSKTLSNYRGLKYITFIECALEGRPDRVKRLGSIVPQYFDLKDRSELRGALLAHMFIDNWDTREENTLLTVNHLGNYQYQTRGVFSDLGTSFGVHLNLLGGDFRVGLVNEYSWDIVKITGDDIHLKSQFNSILKPYAKASYDDLQWMAQRIAQLDQNDFEKILAKSGWPEPLQILYLNKLASRRAQILKAFDISDPHPIPFNRKINIEYKGEWVVKNGVLIKNVDNDQHVLGYLSTKGRLKNYGGSHAH